MTDKDTLKKSHIGNIITAAMIFLSLIWMYSGFKIGVREAALTSAGPEIFKYYTVDSNLLMGIIAAIAAYSQKAVLTGKKSMLSPVIYGLKLAGVVGVTLTMFVSIFFLAPTMEGGLEKCFNNSTLFLHLLNPLISIFVFLVNERTSSIGFRYTFFGILSVIIYAAFYTINCAVYTVNNTVAAGHDWYGFASHGLKAGLLISLPVILISSYVFSIVLWLLNRRK